MSVDKTLKLVQHKLSQVSGFKSHLYSDPALCFLDNPLCLAIPIREVGLTTDLRVVGRGGGETRIRGKTNTGRTKQKPDSTGRTRRWGWFRRKEAGTVHFQCSYKTQHTGPLRHSTAGAKALQGLPLPSTSLLVFTILGLNFAKWPQTLYHATLDKLVSLLYCWKTKY